MDSLVTAFTVTGLDSSSLTNPVTGAETEAEYNILANQVEHTDTQITDKQSALATSKPNEALTDICVINQTEGEKIPRGWSCITHTVTEELADLNSQSLTADSFYLCYKKGNDNNTVDKSPIINIGVWYSNETLPEYWRDASSVTIIKKTFTGKHSANVNNSTFGWGLHDIYVMFKRATELKQNTPVITDLKVIFPDKGEQAPHNYHTIEKSLNTGRIGRKVLLAYKKSFTSITSISYRPSTLFSYISPSGSKKQQQLDISQMPSFCLPMGACIEAWPNHTVEALPVFNTFVLTNELKEQSYGNCLLFYEDYPKNSLSKYQSRMLELDSGAGQLTNLDHTVHANKAICFISPYPYFDAFREFLLYIYKLSISNSTEKRVPIEFLLYHFCSLQAPGLTRTVPRISYKLDPHTTINLKLNNSLFRSNSVTNNDLPQRLQFTENSNSTSSSPSSALLFPPQSSTLTQNPVSPLSSLSSTWTSILLADLSVDNLRRVILFTLLEFKIVFHSLDRDRVTRALEALKSLLFPLKWQLTYIPMCPREVLHNQKEYCSLLDSPHSVMIGVSTEFLNEDLKEDVLFVNMDAGNLHFETSYSENRAIQSLIMENINSIFPSTMNENDQKLLKQCKDKILQEAPTLLNPFGQSVAARESRLSTASGDLLLNQSFTGKESDELATVRRSIEQNIAQVFLNNLSFIFGNYRRFILTKTQRIDDPSVTDLMRVGDFIQDSVRKTNKANKYSLNKNSKVLDLFYQKLTDSQSFVSFIQEVNYVGEGSKEHIEFFDKWTEQTCKFDSDGVEVFVPFRGGFENGLKRKVSSDSGEVHDVIEAPNGEDDMQDVHFDGKFPELKSHLFKLAELKYARKSSNQNYEQDCHDPNHNTERKTSDLLKTLNVFLRSNNEITASNKQNLENFLDYDELWPTRIISQILAIWFLTIPALVTIGRHPVSIVNYAAKQIREKLLSMPKVLTGMVSNRENENSELYYETLKKFWNIGVGSTPDDVFLRVLISVVSKFHLPSNKLVEIIKILEVNNGFKMNAQTLPMWNEELFDFSKKNDLSKTANTEATRRWKLIFKVITVSRFWKKIGDQRRMKLGHYNTSENQSSVIVDLKTPDENRKHEFPNFEPETDSAGHKTPLEIETPLAVEVDNLLAVGAGLSSDSDYLNDNDLPLNQLNLSSGVSTPPGKSGSLGRNKRLDLLDETVDGENPETPTNYKKSKSVPMPISDYLVESLSQADFKEVAKKITESTISVAGTLDKEARSLDRDKLAGYYSIGLSSLQQLATPDRIKKVKQSINTVASSINEVASTYVEANLTGTSTPSRSNTHPGTPGNNPGTPSTPRSGLYPKQKTKDDLDNEHKKAASDAKKFEESIDRHKQQLKFKNLSTNAYDIDIITCSVSANSCCKNCFGLVYEEQVIAGFMSGDSDYQTTCPFCESKFSTTLNIELNMKWREGMVKQASDGCEILRQTLKVNLASPFVLRKEIETFLKHFVNENPQADLLTESPLASSALVDEHQFIFWNLLYYLERLNLQNICNNLLANSKLVQNFYRNIIQESGAALPFLENGFTLLVKLVWDDPKSQLEFHPKIKNLPLYELYLHKNVYGEDKMLEASLDVPAFNKDVLQSILESMRNDDCYSPCLKLFHYLPDFPARRSVYRELLFLVMTGFPNISIEVFEQKFNQAVRSNDLRQEKYDDIPGTRARFLRMLFDHCGNRLKSPGQ